MRMKVILFKFFIRCGCLAFQLELVSSWGLTQTPSAVTKGQDGSIIKGTEFLDPCTILEEHLDKTGTFRLCDIGSTKYGRGLVARRDMNPGEIVLKIPLSQTIFVEEDQNEGSIVDAWVGQLTKILIDKQQDTTDNVFQKYKNVLPPPPPTPARGDWSQEYLEMLEDDNTVREIKRAGKWRIDQWDAYDEQNGGSADTQTYLDTLDLVSSRTIRCGSKFMLVPFLDMANHASQDQGGGFYTIIEGQHGEDEIVLKVGNRGVKAGGEVLLDYGDRTNEEWLIYYGFLPDRNGAESLILPDSQRVITWDDVNTADITLQKECERVLGASASSLQDDIILLKALERNRKNPDVSLILSVKYRIARKTLLSAVAGTKPSSVLSSVFLNFDRI